MSSMEEFIRTQNRIREQFAVPNLVVDRSLQACVSVANIATSLQVEPALFGIMNELQKYREIHEKAFTSFSAVQRVLGPVLEDYHRVSQLVSVAQTLQESILPITNCLKNVQPILIDTTLLSQLSEIRNSVLVEPSVLFELQTAIETQINTSLWEYEVEGTEFEDPFVEEMQEDILVLTESKDKIDTLKQFLAKWGEKGKSVIVLVIKWILLTFIAGLFDSWCEPVYKVLTPSFLLQEEKADGENKIEIPVNTEIHVWNDITNNFIEITYKIDDTEYQGYMEQEEFKTNTEKISDEVELENIIFINDVTQLLSEKWNIQPEQVYSFLKDDTDLLNGYLLKHYEVLGLLDEIELVDNIELYCDEQGIIIPIQGESNDCESSEIE